MVLPKADWKNQPGNLFDWGAIVTGLALIAVYLYLGWTGGWAVYFLMASIIVAWLIGFFTDYWQPILSVFMVIIIAIFSAALLVGDFWERTLNQIAIPLNITFAVLHLYLFYDESRPQG